MQFTDSATLTGPRITADGYLVAEVRCARTGCQDYLASEMGLDGDGAITVYRPEAVVFSKDSMATFAGKPVTVGHPAEAVTADNWRSHAVGDIGEDIARDGEYVRVPIKLMDAAAIKAVQDGTREISMGYSTPIAMQDGIAPDGTAYQAVQTGPIRINHLAIVAKARGGESLRIGDGGTDAGKDRARWGASPLHDRKAPIMADMPTRTVLIDGLSVTTTDAGAQALEKLTKAITDMKAEMTAAETKAKEDAVEKEKLLAKKDAEIDALKKDAMTDAILDARVQARADLIGKAKLIAKDVTTTGLSDAAIRKAAVVAVLGDVAIAGKSEAYTDARFDILAEDAAKGDPVAKALADGTKVILTDLASVYTERNKSLSDAWKAPVKKEA